MTTITKASHQWASRPDDQRFLSLTDLNAFCQNARNRSAGKVLSSRAIECDVVANDSKALIVHGPNGTPATLTHWAFGQLAARADAPAGYLRDLPAPLAADCINYGLKHSRDIEDMGMLLYKPEDYDGTDGRGLEVRAVTGPNYGRIWNSQITSALCKQFGDGVTGGFRVPGEFGNAVTVDKGNTTLYASDRDMFVFLADEEHRIEIPNRRDGQAGSLARGFFVWNSEVGAQSFGVATFLFDYVCKNRIVWGAEQYAEIRIRHTSGAPDRWLEQVRPAIESFATSSTHNVVKAITDARAARVDDVDAFLATRKFTRAQAIGIKAAHMQDEGRPIENLWDVATGVTAYARGVQYQDARVTLEREAGKILDMA